MSNSGSEEKIKKPWEFDSPLCSQIGGDLFFFSDSDDPQQPDNNAINLKESKKICKSCVHIVECAEWGLRHESYGIWGGMSPKELAEVRKKRKIPLKTVTLADFYAK